MIISGTSSNLAANTSQLNHYHSAIQHHHHHHQHHHHSPSTLSIGNLNNVKLARLCGGTSASSDCSSASPTRPSSCSSSSTFELSSTSLQNHKYNPKEMFAHSATAANSTGSAYADMSACQTNSMDKAQLHAARAPSEYYSEYHLGLREQQQHFDAALVVASLPCDQDENNNNNNNNNSNSSSSSSDEDHHRQHDVLMQKRPMQLQLVNSRYHPYSKTSEQYSESQPAQLQLSSTTVYDHTALSVQAYSASGAQSIPTQYPVDVFLNYQQQQQQQQQQQHQQYNYNCDRVSQQTQSSSYSSPFITQQSVGEVEMLTPNPPTAPSGINNASSYFDQAATTTTPMNYYAYGAPHRDNQLPPAACQPTTEPTAMQSVSLVIPSSKVPQYIAAVVPTGYRSSQSASVSSGSVQVGYAAADFFNYNKQYNQSSFLAANCEKDNYSYAESSSFTAKNDFQSPSSSSSSSSSLSSSSSSLNSSNSASPLSYSASFHVRPNNSIESSSQAIFLDESEANSSVGRNSLKRHADSSSRNAAAASCDGNSAVNRQSRFGSFSLSRAIKKQKTSQVTSSRKGDLNTGEPRSKAKCKQTCATNGDKSNAVGQLSTSVESVSAFSSESTKLSESSGVVVVAAAAATNSDEYLHQAGEPKKRVSANKKERRRTQSINYAFTELRNKIPKIPKDTKLSKIKTLKLATDYIEHLMRLLEESDTTDHIEISFKPDLGKLRRECRSKEIKQEVERKTKGRTGWPPDVWATELRKKFNADEHQSRMSLDALFAANNSKMKQSNNQIDNIHRDRSTLNNATPYGSYIFSETNSITR